MDKIGDIFKKLGLSFKADDYFELNEEATGFRMINKGGIVNKLCERLIHPNLYYHPIKRMYCEWMPWQCFNDKSVLGEIDVSVFKVLFKKDALHLLCRLFNVLSEQSIMKVLKSLHPIQLESMMENKEYYALELSAITSKSKAAYINTMVLDCISPRGIYLNGKINSKEAIEVRRAIMDNDAKKVMTLIMGRKFKRGDVNRLSDVVERQSHKVLDVLLQYKLYTQKDLDEALFCAIDADNRYAVKALLSTKEVSPNIMRKPNATPLMSAAGYGQLQTCKLLLEHKAYTNPQHSFFKKTASEFAKAAGYSEIVSLLEKNQYRPG